MKYLVIRFSSLGDCILLCEFLSSLKERGAEEVSIVTKEPYRELFTAVRGVDSVFCLQNGSNLFDLYRFAASFRSSGYRIIDAHNTLRSRIFTTALGAHAPRLKKYYRSRLELILFKKRVQIPTMAERYADLEDATQSGGVVRHLPVLEIPEAIERSIPPVLDRHESSFIALAPGSRWPMKRWGAERFCDLARAIIDRFGYSVMLLGDDGDRDANGALARSLGNDVLDLTGQTSILQAAACLKRARALVTNDSGLMHLAEAVGTPVLGIFGPTVKEFGYYPSLAASKTCERTLPCRPCSRNGARACPMGTQECMATIDTAVVTEIFADLMAGTGPRRYLLP